MNEEQGARILIADDEPLYLRTTGELLRKAGYWCECVGDANAALSALSRESFDLILSDLNMPGNLNLELLRQGRQDWAHIPLIVVTGVPSLPTAIESIRLGITDYLLKPVKYQDLLTSVRRALAQRSQVFPAPERDDTQRGDLARQFPEIIGDSQPMLELFDIMDRVAGTNVNVLITGESGTGKEIVARSIHRHSPRAKHPFHIIDCTAIPESLFESVLFGHAKGSFTGAVKDQAGLLRQCDQGTAFFDEIGELPATLQAKLLRVVQEQTFTPVGESAPVQFDTRFICATNRDLRLEVNSGRFRRDLFYRLGVIHIELPPLYQREDDVILLAQHFLSELRSEFSTALDFSSDVISCFRKYRWPGNIRELRNVVERALTLARSELIEVDDLPPSLHPSSVAEREMLTSGAEASRIEALSDAECVYLTSLLQKYRGNVSQAARQAGMSRQGMHKLLKKHRITAADFRE
jgi:two-component system response regulator AtoC